MTEERLDQIENSQTAKTNLMFREAVNEIRRLRALLQSVERRIGSASLQSAWADAMECAEWIKGALAKYVPGQASEAQRILEGEK